MKLSNLIVTLIVAGFASSSWALTVSIGQVAQKTNAVAVGEVVVNGQQVEVLTDASGMSLYTFSEDAAGKSNCVGGCLVEWPPLNVVSNATVLPPFGIINGNNGKPQLTLLGLPLYHFAGDSKPGDANGNYPAWSSIIVTTGPTL